MPTVHRDRRAMATRFEIWLRGDDEDHLLDVAEAALDEVARIDRLLSRFDPASEVARINRDRQARVDVELFAILRDVRDWQGRTEGYFSACPRSVPGRAFRLDAADRTVRLDPSAHLDFGAFGKGYALDAAGRILSAFDVRSALLHGGTSSVLALGTREDESPWTIILRDHPIGLLDSGLSTSATFEPGAATSDIVDPTTGATIATPAACSVIAPTAAEAEVWSTALLAMGGDRASRFLGEGRAPGCRVAWIDRDATSITWLDGRN